MKPQDVDLQTFASASLPPTLPPPFTANRSELVVSLCNLFADVVRLSDVRSDLFHLRDFIFFLRRVWAQFSRSPEPDLVKAIVVGVARNFSCVSPHSFREIVNSVGRRVAEAIGHDWVDVGQFPLQLSCLRDALGDTLTSHGDLIAPTDERQAVAYDAVLDPLRFIAVIDSATTESAHRLLRQVGVAPDIVEVIRVVCFASDSAALARAAAINRVKQCMAAGRTCFLINCADIFSNFYDVFNRNIRLVRVGDSSSKFFANISIGSISRPCEMHPSFQMVVFLSAADAMTTPLPFLNRCEKYAISPRTLFNDLTSPFEPEAAQAWLDALAACRQWRDAVDRRSFCVAPSDESLHSLLLAALVRGDISPERAPDFVAAMMSLVIRPTALYLRRSTLDPPLLSQLVSKLSFSMQHFLASHVSMSRRWVLIARADVDSNFVANDAYGAGVDVKTISSYGTVAEFEKDARVFASSNRVTLVAVVSSANGPAIGHLRDLFDTLSERCDKTFIVAIETQSHAIALGDVYEPVWTIGWAFAFVESLHGISNGLIDAEHIFDDPTRIVSALCARFDESLLQSVVSLSARYSAQMLQGLTARHRLRFLPMGQRAGDAVKELLAVPQVRECIMAAVTGMFSPEAVEAAMATLSRAVEVGVVSIPFHRFLILLPSHTPSVPQQLFGKVVTFLAYSLLDCFYGCGNLKAVAACIEANDPAALFVVVSNLRSDIFAASSRLTTAIALLSYSPPLCLSSCRSSRYFATPYAKKSFDVLRSLVPSGRFDSSLSAAVRASACSESLTALLQSTLSPAAAEAFFFDALRLALGGGVDGTPTAAVALWVLARQLDALPDAAFIVALLVSERQSIQFALRCLSTLPDSSLTALSTSSLEASSTMASVCRTVLRAALVAFHQNDPPWTAERVHAVKALCDDQTMSELQCEDLLPIAKGLRTIDGAVSALRIDGNAVASIMKSLVDVNAPLETLLAPTEAQLLTKVATSLSS